MLYSGSQRIVCNISTVEQTHTSTPRGDPSPARQLGTLDELKVEQSGQHVAGCFLSGPVWKVLQRVLR